MSAMKAKDAQKLALLRIIKGDMDRSVESKDFDDATVLKIIKKNLDELKETGGSVEDIAVLESYMPKQMTGEEIARAVEDIIYSLDASGMSDMGKVMSAFKATYAGMADGKTVSTMVKFNLVGGQ